MGSPLPKTFSRIGIFMHEEKFEKQLHIHRKKQVITFPVKMQRLNHVLHKNKYYIYLSQNTEIQSLQKYMPHNPPF